MARPVASAVVMLPSMPDDQPAPPGPDSDDHWAEAEELLSGEPDDATHSRLRRARHGRLLTVLGVTVVVALLVVPVVLLLEDGSSSSDAPLWQVVVGFWLAALGVVISLVAVVRTPRAARRRRGRSTPLFAVTPVPREELLAQVRGRGPVDPARTGLARRLAEDLVRQRFSVWNSCGLTALWVGQAVAIPAWWRVCAAVAFAVLTAATAVPIQRDARGARAFLAAHPG